MIISLIISSNKHFGLSEYLILLRIIYWITSNQEELLFRFLIVRVLDRNIQNVLIKNHKNHREIMKIIFKFGNFI